MWLIEPDIVLDGRVVDETVDEIRLRQFGAKGGNSDQVAEIQHPHLDPLITVRQASQALPVAAERNDAVAFRGQVQGNFQTYPGTCPSDDISCHVIYSH
ncbi:hypothetical protein D9M72_610760 [compost metagenome]